MGGRPCPARFPPPCGTSRGSVCPCAGAGPASSAGWKSCWPRGCALPSPRGSALPPPLPPLAAHGGDLGRGKGLSRWPPHPAPRHPPFQIRRLLRALRGQWGCSGAAPGPSLPAAPRATAGAPVLRLSSSGPAGPCPGHSLCGAGLERDPPPREFGSEGNCATTRGGGLLFNCLPPAGGREGRREGGREGKREGRMHGGRQNGEGGFPEPAPRSRGRTSRSPSQAAAASAPALSATEQPLCGFSRRV